MIGKEMFCDYILLPLFDSFFCCEYSSINIFDYIKKNIVILYQLFLRRPRVFACNWNFFVLILYLSGLYY